MFGGAGPEPCRMVAAILAQVAALASPSWRRGAWPRREERERALPRDQRVRRRIHRICVLRDGLCPRRRLRRRPHLRVGLLYTIAAAAGAPPALLALHVRAAAERAELDTPSGPRHTIRLPVGQTVAI